MIVQCARRSNTVVIGGGLVLSRSCLRPSNIDFILLPHLASNVTCPRKPI